MMYAVIDIGSNSIRLSIYKAEQSEITLLFHKKAMTGLAAEVNTENKMSAHGIQKAIYVLNEFSITLQNLSITQTYVIATASLRNIRNTTQAVDAIERATGFTVRVLTGEEEALFDFDGALHGAENSDGLLVDIGGGSTELVFYQNSQAVFARSIPLGSLSCFHRFVDGLLPLPHEIKNIRDVMKNALYELAIPAACLPLAKTICGVGGTARNAVKLYNEWYDQPRENHTFDVASLRDMVKCCKNANKRHMNRLLQTIPERIHTITPGLILLHTIAKFCGSESIWISQNGVREGYLYHMLAQQEVLA